MKGLGKRLAALSVCSMILCLLPIAVYAATGENCQGQCAHQAAVSTVHYDTLEEALGAVPEGGRVTLLQDLSPAGTIAIEKSITLDLGGKTLHSPLVLTADTTLCCGTVISDSDSALDATDCTVTLAGDVKLVGCGTAPTVILSASDAPAEADKPAREIPLGGRTVLQVSGEIIAGADQNAIYTAPSRGGTCEVYISETARITSRQAAALCLACEGKLEITGGVFTSDTDSIAVHGALEATVTGGTFRKVPGDYIPSYCKIRENADGTFTVISAYSLTFRANGGSGTMESLIVRCGSSVSLPQSTLLPPKDMDFAGWEIDGILYAPGERYTPEADATVIALWKSHAHTGGSATCLKKAVCETCGRSYGKLGKHHLASVAGYAATCATAGMKAHDECRVCGRCFADGVMVFASSLSIPAPGHCWETVEGVPAACEEDGRKSYRTCKTCGTLQAEGKPATEAELVIPAPGHTLQEISATPATCKNAGIRAHQHCTSCHGLFLEGKPAELSQLTTAVSSHILSDWQCDEACHWKCCIDCGEVFRLNRHTNMNAAGICDDCGFAMTPEENTTEKSGLSPLFLTPIIAAVAVAALLTIKKRK